MGDDLVKQFIAELQDLVQCRCHEAFKGRGLHDPDCHCDTAEAVKVVANRIEELEAKLADRDAMVEAAYRMALEDASTWVRPQIAPSGNGVVVAALHRAADDLLTLNSPDDLVGALADKLEKAVGAYIK